MSLFDQFQKLKITLPLHLVALFSPLSEPANVLGDLLNQPESCLSRFLTCGSSGTSIWAVIAVSAAVKHEAH